jgi:transcriptional regulator with XRE-family HTH domain
MTPAAREKQEARSGGILPKQLLAANVRAGRALINLSQQDLAERMSALKHAWSRPTVSQVERAARAVSVDELYGLAHALRVDIRMLLSPPQGSDVQLDTGLPELMPAEAIRGILNHDSPWRPAVSWADNKPTGVIYPGADLLQDVLKFGASPGQVAFLQHMLEESKRLEEQR